MLRAVSFDLDDTLCTFTDAERTARHRIVAHVASELSLPEADLAAAYRAANDRRLAHAAAGYWIKNSQFAHTVACWHEALEPFIGKAQAGARALLVARRFLDVRRAALRLYDDALPAIRAAGARMPLALISNGPRDNQRLEAVYLGIDAYFTTLVFEAELGFGKPAAEPFRAAAEGLGCRPEELVHVGDSLAADVAGAKAVGALAIWLRRGDAGLPSPDETADAIITSLAELPVALDVLRSRGAMS